MSLATATLTAALGPVAYSSMTSAASAAASDCPSGYLCVWSGTGFTGSVKKFSTASQYTVIGLSINQSIYNNRSKRAFLEKQRSGSDVELCLDPGESRSNLSGWQEDADGVYLSNTAAC
jgi:hypothetical protein